MKIYIKYFLFITISATFLFGCSDDNLAKYQKLDELKVLAIKANLPEVSPGATVALTPVISDFNGSGRTLNYTVEACTDPGVGFGANPSCDGQSTKVSIGSGSVTLAAPNYTQAVSAINIPIPTDVLNNRTVIEQYNGVAYLVVFSFSATGGETSTKAFKRIIVSTKSLKNTNPTLGDILAGDASFRSILGNIIAVSPSVVGEAQEDYLQLNTDGSLSNFKEALSVTWFSTKGSFSKTRTVNFDNNFYNPTSNPDGKPRVVVAIIRDDRGGEDYLIRSF